MGLQITESEGVLTVTSALFPFGTGEETEAQSRKATCTRSNNLFVIESRVEPGSSGF